MISTCVLCSKEGVCESHHVVFRSQAPYMKLVNVNLVNLCVECHRGNQGAHLDKRTDLKLKLQLQAKLFDMFSSKRYFTEIEIKDILKVNDTIIYMIVKKLCLYRKGYEVEQLVRRMLGGQLYD